MTVVALEPVTKPQSPAVGWVPPCGLLNTARLIVIFDAVTAEGGPTNPSMYPNLSLASDTAEPTSSSWSC